MARERARSRSVVRATERQKEERTHPSQRSAHMAGADTRRRRASVGPQALAAHLDEHGVLLHRLPEFISVHLLSSMRNTKAERQQRYSGELHGGPLKSFSAARSPPCCKPTDIEAERLEKVPLTTALSLT